MGSVQLPSDAQILDIWQSYHSQEALEAYRENIIQGELMERPFQKAKITSTKKLAELDATEYLLENGARIITKKTDFDKNSVTFYALSKGGINLYSDKDYPSVWAAPMYSIYSGINGLDYNQLVKKLSEKQVNISLRIRQQDEDFSGTAPKDSVETLLQLVSLFMTKPQFNDEGWNQVTLTADYYAKSNGVQPYTVFSNKINEIIFGKDFLHQSISSEFAAQLDRKKAERIFKERFTNAADWTFIFVGDIDEKSLPGLCASYIGSIPGNASQKEEVVYRPFSFPKGITTQTVKKGIEPQGAVYIGFGGNLPPAEDVSQGWEQAQLLEQLRSYLDIKLREVIREDKSGSYGINVSTVLDGYPERFFTVEIVFGCEPERAEELSAEVIKQIQHLQATPVDQSYVDKLNETYRRSAEINLRNNSWWLNKIISTLVLTYEPFSSVSDFASVPAWTTPEAISELAQKYLDTKNLVQVYLKPEK